MWRRSSQGKPEFRWWPGLAVGVVVSLARYLLMVLYGVRSRDPLTPIGVSAALLLVTAAAIAIPARHAARTNPKEALWQE